MQTKKQYITPGTTVVALNAEVHLLFKSKEGSDYNPGG